MTAQAAQSQSLPAILHRVRFGLTVTGPPAHQVVDPVNNTEIVRVESGTQSRTLTNVFILIEKV